MYVYLFFFFFKQTTEYEMRISDWSSDGCSSDLGIAVALDLVGEAVVLVLTIADQAGQFFVETDPKHALAVRIEGHIIAELRRDGDASLAINRCKIGARISAGRHNRHRCRPRFAPPGKTSPRSDERRVGNECVHTGRSRWSPDH